MSSLTPDQIVQWYREKAREYDHRADDIERDFNIKPNGAKAATTAPLANGVNLIRLNDVHTVEAVLQKKQAARVADIAKETGFSAEMVLAILERHDFVKGDQGWWRIKPVLNQPQ